MRITTFAVSAACVIILVSTSACGTLSIPKRAELVGSYVGLSSDQDDLELYANGRFAHEFSYEGRYHVERGRWEYDPISDPLQNNVPDTIGLITDPGPRWFGYLVVTGFNDPHAVWGARAITGAASKCSNGDLMIGFGDFWFYRYSRQWLISCPHD